MSQCVFRAIAVIICAGAVVSASASGVRPTASDFSAILDRLDYVLENRERYLDNRQRDIDGKKRLAMRKRDVASFNALADSYLGVSSDSALRYYEEAAMVSDLKSNAHQLMLARCIRLLPEVGFPEMSRSVFAEIDTTFLTPDELLYYYCNASLMYHSLSAVYADHPMLAVAYNDTACIYEDRLLHAELSDKNASTYALIRARALIRRGDIDAAERLMLDVFAEEPEGSRQHREAADALSDMMLRRGDMTAMRYYKTAATISEIIAGDRDMTHMVELGMMLEDIGDHERAYRYLRHVLGDDDGKSDINVAIGAARTIPYLQDNIINNMRSSYMAVSTLVWVLVIVVLMLCAVVWYYVRRLRAQKRLSERYVTAGDIKDICIADYVGLCADSVLGLSDFSRDVLDKINAGKTAEAVRLIKTEKIASKTTDRFFDVFDMTFLKLFPTFVADVKALLRDDAQIILKEGELLNVDLRILALMRMGIGDCSQIAALLGYSLNTIYTYRNKLKSHARNRETFEADMLNIPSV